MKFALLLLILATTFSAHATIYIVAYDKATGAMGVAVSSSGPAFFDKSRMNNSIHGVGIAVAGGMGFCKKATPLDFLEEGLTAKEVALRVAEQCDPVQPYYRLAVVTNNGDVYVHSGADGCNPDNIVCANLQGEGFGVTGGGLEEGVAEVAFESFKKQPTTIPLECRLFNTLDALYEAGGEIWRFKTAGIMVGYPGEEDFRTWQTTGRREHRFLARLQYKMQKDDVTCPGWEDL